MTAGFIKTLFERDTGELGEDAVFTRHRLCRRDDGRYFLVSEQPTASCDWDDHEVRISPSNEAGEKLAAKAATLTDVNWRCIIDDAIIAAIVAL